MLATELWPNSMHVCSGKGGVPRCVIETRVITVIIPWKMGEKKSVVFPP